MSQGREGDSCGNVRGFTFTLFPQYGVNTKDLCYIGKNGSACIFSTLIATDILYSGGGGGGGGGETETPVVLPTCCPCSVGLLAGVYWKVKVPAIPGG